MLKRSQSRETSIFPYKPTHLRVKTEIDSSKQNQLSQNNFSIKKYLHNVRFSEFQTNFSQKTSNKTLIFQKPSKQKSIFGQIHLQKQKFQKQTILTQQLQHPLKDYINQVKQKKVSRSMKRYKTACDQCRSLPRRTAQNLTMIPFKKPFKRLETEAPTQVVSKEHQVLFKLIDEIYKKISNFKLVGYTQKKINEWIQKYCLQNRKYMTGLLMKSSGKHKFSETCQDYFYERNPHKVKEKLLFVKKKINGQERSIDQRDLLEFSNYIEEILIQKNKKKIVELRDSITQKLQECFIYNRERNEQQFGKKLYPPDLLNFVCDMNQIELKHGYFNNISTFNRQYFTDLGKVQNDVRSKIYQLIKVSQNHKNDIIPSKQMQKISTLKLLRHPQKSQTTIENHKSVRFSGIQEY